MKLRKHRTLREQIVSSLRDSIVKGELKPGQKLTEPELAERLGISRTPIREAFRQLESEGFLSVIPRRGAVVSELSRKEIADFYDIKSLLEGYAARIAAGKITDKDIRKLEGINGKLEEAARAKDLATFFKCNEDFHRVYMELCGNEKLHEIRDSMVQRYHRFRLQALSVPGRLMKSVQQHKNIIKAFEKHDGRLVEAMVVEHALLGGEELAEQVKKGQAEDAAG
jgi:DNA-binding GntR family transcriptional regulator